MSNCIPTVTGQWGEAGSVALRELWVPLYVPSAVYSVGLGAVVAMVAVLAVDYGATLAGAGMIVGLILIGRLFGNIPSATLCSALGEQRAMILAAAVSILVSLTVLFVPNLAVLAVGAWIVGMATATFVLARQILLTRAVDPRYRGRAMSILAGTHRFGMTIGPFATAAMIGLAGAESAFWLHIAACAVAIGLLMVVPDPEVRLTPRGTVGRTASIGGGSRGKTHHVFNDHVGVLMKLGIATGLLMLLRASREVILPLWGLAVGASGLDIALAVGASGAFELFLFYASGLLIDRLGILAVILPVTLGLAFGHLCLLFVTSTPGLYAAGLFLGLVNSLGLGVHMTLGSMLAPPGHTGTFLGLWRLFGDGGMAVAPLLISGATAVGTLGLAASLIGVLGAVGAVMLWRWIPQYVDSPGRKNRNA